MKIYKVPARFYDDHIGRDCGDSDQVIRFAGNSVYVELTETTYADLMSDADYYIYMARELDASYRGLVSSAKATVKALQKQGRPDEGEMK